MCVLKEYLYKKRILIILFLFVTGVSAWFSAEFSSMLGKVFDVVEGNSSQSLFDVAKVTLIYLLISIVFELVSNCLKAYNVKGINTFIENTFVMKLYKKSILEYNKKNKTEYESYLINDIKQVQELYVENMFQIIGCIIRVILSLIVLLKISIVGTAIVCVLSVLPIVLSFLINAPIMKQVTRFSATKTKYIKETTEGLEGHDTFSLYGNRHAAIRKNNIVNSEEAETKKKAFIWIESLSAIVGVSSISITVLSLVGGMYLALNGYITVGEVFALSFISNGISSPLMELSEKIPNFIGGKAFLDKYNDLVQYQRIVEPCKILTNLKNIKLEDVTLEIDRRILDNVNIEIEKGKKYLFIGQSGSGKSTVVKTLLGQNSNYKGNIYYDGNELRNIIEKDIYRNITYIPQKSELFNDTIRNNVSLFNQNISDDEIYKALEFVNMKKTVLKLPGKLDYCVSDSKSNLSGGEKQRVSLARAVLYCKPILIMDEATSALDNENFNDIENKLINMKDVTVINIVHRLRKDIVEQYDKVIEFNDGKVKAIYEAKEYMA